MPIKPSPTHYSCPRCGWEKTVAPESDDRTIGIDCFIECPECGYKDLETRQCRVPCDYIPKRSYFFPNTDVG
ncbi:MAG TPA: hypothetical protein EYP34_14600 [Chromatiaceae bacterium]|nr:hypothetical protein [Chromatiaceae bacterium]